MWGWVLGVAFILWILYSKKSKKLCIVLGSGGHSSEMMRILNLLDLKNKPLLCVYASGDPTAVHLLKKITEGLSQL